MKKTGRTNYKNLATKQNATIILDSRNLLIYETKTQHVEVEFNNYGDILTSRVKLVK